MNNVVNFPTTPEIHNRRLMAERNAQPEIDYIHPTDVRDAFVMGVASVTDIGNGLVRVKLWGDENKTEKYRVICSQHVLARETALKIADEIKTALR